MQNGAFRKGLECISTGGILARKSICLSHLVPATSLPVPARQSGLHGAFGAIHMGLDAPGSKRVMVMEAIGAVWSTSILLRIGLYSGEGDTSVTIDKNTIRH